MGTYNKKVLISNWCEDQFDEKFTETRPRLMSDVSKIVLMIQCRYRIVSEFLNMLTIVNRLNVIGKLLIKLNHFMHTILLKKSQTKWIKIT